jgi:hypothetical protein
MGYGMGGRGSNPDRGKIFSSPQRSDRLRDPLCLRCNGTEDDFPEGKVTPACDHSSLSSVGFRNYEDTHIPPFAHAPSWHSASLLQHRNNFTLPVLFHQYRWQRSRYRDWLRAGRPRGRSSSPGRVKNFRFSMSSRPALGSTQPHLQRVPGALSPGIKRPEREADHSPPTSAEVKKMWICTPTSPYTFMA